MPRMNKPDEDNDSFFLKEAELNKDATYDEIKAAYKQLSLKYHPDMIKGEVGDPALQQQKIKTEEIFKRLNDGYHALTKPENVNEKSGVNETDEFQNKHQTHSYHGEDNPEGILLLHATLKVFLPIYVLKTANPAALAGYGISLPAAELDSPARFQCIIERVNKYFTRISHQVGLDIDEAKKIVNQRSFYKNPLISFVSALVIEVKLADIDPSTALSEARSDPYFWLKSDTVIEINQILSLIPCVNYDFDNQVMQDLNKKYQPYLASEAILIKPKQYFDFYQPLKTKGLIQEALDQYRKECELTQHYGYPTQDILNITNELIRYHTSDVAKLSTVIDFINTHKNDYRGKLQLIMQAMENYYKILNNISRGKSGMPKTIFLCDLDDTLRACAGEKILNKPLIKAMKQLRQAGQVDEIILLTAYEPGQIVQADDSDNYCSEVLKRVIHETDFRFMSGGIDTHSPIADNGSFGSFGSFMQRVMDLEQKVVELSDIKRNAFRTICNQYVAYCNSVDNPLDIMNYLDTTSNYFVKLFKPELFGKINHFGNKAVKGLLKTFEGLFKISRNESIVYYKDFCVGDNYLRINCDYTTEKGERALTGKVHMILYAIEHYQNKYPEANLNFIIADDKEEVITMSTQLNIEIKRLNQKIQLFPVKIDMLNIPEDGYTPIFDKLVFNNNHLYMQLKQLISPQNEQSTKPINQIRLDLMPFKSLLDRACENNLINADALPDPYLYSQIIMNTFHDQIDIDEIVNKLKMVKNEILDKNCHPPTELQIAIRNRINSITSYLVDAMYVAPNPSLDGKVTQLLLPSETFDEFLVWTKSM